MTVKLPRRKLLASLPPEWPDDLLPEIQERVAADNHKIVVLDDDPTGSQTVHGVPVLTDWSVDLLSGALREPDPVVFILTNSRSLCSDDALDLSRRIARNLKAARRATGRDFVVVSRSDSTLRGHYPGETDILAIELEQRVDGVILVPFFAEGGRLTLGDTHYVAQADALVPAAETEYARDADFGYTHSDLREWVSEKHAGLMEPGEVMTLTLQDIRIGGPDMVADKLMTLGSTAEELESASCGIRPVCIANSVTYGDLEVVVAGMLRAESAGKRFLCRTAASFVRVRGGIPPRPLLTASELAPSSPTAVGGLVVAGSHVQKTTRQIASAAALPDITYIEVSVPGLLDPELRNAEIARAAAQAERALTCDLDALVVTSREIVAASDGHEGLTLGQSVSRCLAELVQRIAIRPAWIIAKGGITSSDIATLGLGVRRATVLGQAIPGVPIWRTGPESRWPDQVFVVFPGNVGDDDALARMISILRGSPPPGRGSEGVAA